MIVKVQSRKEKNYLLISPSSLFEWKKNKFNMYNEIRSHILAKREE